MVSSISVIGLGKLGACTAVCFAAKGLRVIGVDVNQQFMRAANQWKMCRQKIFISVCLEES